MRRLALLLLLAGPLVAGCSGDPHADYCEAVEEHQATLTDVAASEDAGALLGALDTYDALAEQAPGDIADDWAAVIDPLRDLGKAFDDHGVDASSYVAGDAPPGLDDDARRAIEAAARRVGSARTVEAMAAVEHHARDVCGTPLSR